MDFAEYAEIIAAIPEPWRKSLIRGDILQMPERSYQSGGGKVHSRIEDREWVPEDGENLTREMSALFMGMDWDMPAKVKLAGARCFAGRTEWRRINPPGWEQLEAILSTGHLLADFSQPQVQIHDWNGSNKCVINPAISSTWSILDSTEIPRQWRQAPIEEALSFLRTIEYERHPDLIAVLEDPLHLPEDIAVQRTGSRRR